MPKLVIRDGRAEMVYSDQWACIARALGAVTIERATDVEYNPAAQVWEARHRETGQVIATGANRSQVIAEEVKFLEGRL